MKKIAIPIISLAVLLAVGGFAYYNKVYIPAQAQPEPTYNTTRVRTSDISITASGAGSVVPNEKVKIGFQTGGTLAELDVKVGDTVKAGQVLAQLDATDAQLKLRQAELNFESFYAPETRHEAEIAQLDAKAKLEAAVDQLEYLVSPQVYYWETNLGNAQAELARLEATGGTPESDLEAARKAVLKAESYLNGAQYEYLATYVWEVFPYSYDDEETGETIDTYLAPNSDSVTLARLAVKTAELALQDAEDYLQALNAGKESQPTAVYADSDLAKLDQARLDLASAQADLAKTRLIAPIDGTITEVNANTGQAIGTAPFITIETLDQMALRFFLEEGDIHLVTIGNPVNIIFEAYPDQPVVGKITYLEPAMETIDGTPAAVVWAELPEEIGIRLLSGMSAEVEVIAGQAADALLVPVQALRELAPGSYAVFVLDANGDLKLTPVTVGLKDYANAQILTGLKAGDVVSTGAVETK